MSPVRLMKLSALLIPSTPKLRRTSYLDGMRGTAALIVVFFHAAWAYTGAIELGYGLHGANDSLIQLPFLRLIHAGPAMVCVFFLIGGYVNSLQPMQAIHERQWDKLALSIGSSVLRRGIRLYIPPVFATFVSAITIYLGLWERSRVNINAGLFVVADLHPDRQPTLHGQLTDWWHHTVGLFNLWTYFSTSNAQPYYDNYDPHMWTVPYEVRSSMILALVLVVVGRCRPVARRLLLLALMTFSLSWGRWEVVLFLAGAMLTDWHLYSHRKDESLPTTDDEAEKRYELPSTGRSLSKSAGTAAALLLGLYLLSAPNVDIESTPGYMSLGSAIPQISNSSALQQVFLTRWTQYLGQISYALYIVHGPILHIVGYTLTPALWNVFGSDDRPRWWLGFVMGNLCTFGLIFLAANYFQVWVDTTAAQHLIESSNFGFTCTGVDANISGLCSTGSILSLPFRRSTQLSLASVIRQYINNKYDQHPEMFKQDLEVIDALRHDAITVREPHLSGIKKLEAYAGQLAWIAGKFPIDIGAEFTWYPALGYNSERPMVRNNMKYELLNVLYNLAALYSQLAVNSSRGTAEGIKTAANHFSLAAGVLSHMRKEVVPELRMSDPPEDMDDHTLESLMQLLLAQSQECFWQKAVVDGYKDASIAKLAARVSDLYNMAGEAAMKSEAISSAWIHHMTAKHHHFAAAAQYRAACDCLEKRKYGEEVARLTDAVACVIEGLKETKGGYLNKTVVDDLNGLKRKVEEDLKRAEKDNDMIFLNPVPPKSELKILERANMAVARVPPQVASPFDFLGDRAEFGPALFSRLVPFSVHVAISIYEERRDRMVNQNIIQELELLNDKIHSLFSAIGLPGSLQAMEKPLGLPPSLVQHAEELRQADAIGRLRKSFADIDKLRAADVAIFEDGKLALAAENEEDQQARRKYGTDRWTRPESQGDAQGGKLWGHSGEIEGYFASSASSDSVVRDKFTGNEELFHILCGSDRALMDFVPSSSQRDTNPDLKTSVGKLRSAYNDILRLESRRRKKVEILRENARKDDIKPDILKEAARLERTYPSTAIVPAHFEDFFEERLDRLYEPELNALDKESLEQERLLKEVERANAEFESQKRRCGDRGSREREQALQKLDNAYFKYKEIVNNLEVGRKFYNDLNKIVGQGFRDVVKGWVAQRRLEARALEEELSMPPLSTLSLSHSHTPLQSSAAAQYQPSQPSYFVPEPAARQHPSSPQRQHGHVARQSMSNPVEASIQSWAGDTVQQPQPVAPQINPMTTMWNPAMGIKFGGGGPPAPGNDHGQQGGSGSTTWNPSAGIKFG
ncbi:pH-response regulator protein palA/rim20 [Metarhizium rileyi]|uniref:pH-response regulator protein palA/rim20 n=1 Tax=Metarhizium rileyi (strain RCEF 4871) TaxID=1649241 RepID=A0A5C6GB36_METRR|nr:pH-response regulator protein palA/rim20 [Metarhizium rileyi]